MSETTVTIEVVWTKYPNFFELWRAHQHSTKLLYVIGEQHHCYIGCIGCDDGKGGLGQRYQWQYVNRARAIFGRDEADGQPAYAGTFPDTDSVTPELILAAEANVQGQCVVALGRDAILFRPEKAVDGITVHHVGGSPPFLSNPPEHG